MKLVATMKGHVSEVAKVSNILVLHTYHIAPKLISSDTLFLETI